MEVKQHRNRVVRTAMNADDVPREGMINRRELETVFGRSWQTLKKWLDKGLIPEPINSREPYKSIMSVTSPLTWKAGEIWEAYNKIQGGLPDGKL